MERWEWLRSFARCSSEAGPVHPHRVRPPAPWYVAADRPDGFRQSAASAQSGSDRNRRSLGMQAPRSNSGISQRPSANDDPYHQAREIVVRRINSDRAAAGLGSVELDELSSQVADAHCQEMAANQYLSHWNLRGLLPYHRYHFAGGRDYVQENLSRMTVFSSLPNPISTAPEDVAQSMLNAHQRFIDERLPLDCRSEGNTVKLHSRF